VRYNCITRCRKQFSISMMCRLLSVSRSGYYAWSSRPESERDKQNVTFKKLIKGIHTDYRGVYGAPRMCAELNALGHHCGVNRIAKLMRQAGLKGRPRRRARRSLQAQATFPFAKNLLKQQFHAARPNEVWSSDISYIQTRQGFVYLAIVLDLYSRKIVGWAMDSSITRHLAIEALEMAIDMRKPAPGLIHHSDRGVQYYCDDYRLLLERNGILCSMSARGNCYDNAVVESFFGSLKREWIRKYRYTTRDEAKLALFNYIECFYNRKRRHGYLGYVSPNEFELTDVGAN
jgi:putative transposase